MKNFRKSLLISAAFVFTAAFSGCTIGNNNPDSDSEEDKRISPQSITFDWQNAYSEKLIEFRNSSEYSADSKNGSRFDLFDITGDKTPELIISPNNQSQTACRIYSCSNGQLIELGETGNSGTFYYLPDMKLIKDEYVGESFVLGKYISYNNGEFDTIITYNDNAISAASGAAIYYKIDGLEVLLPEYDAALAPYKNAAYVNAGRKYTFGDKALNYALKCSESWGAVIDNNQRQLYKSKLSEILASAPESEFAFELCDLNSDENPELIISNGNTEECYCEVYYYEDSELKHIEGKFGAYGQFTFDAEQFVISAGAVRWSINNSNFSADEYKYSDSLADIGRKYLLTEQNINIALN